jgi:peptide/nickel transport system ATP-binding protein
VTNRDEIFGTADDLGEPPSLIDPPAGCRFHPRCPFAMEQCRTEAPPRMPREDGHWADCWLHAAGRADLLDTPSMTSLISRRTAEDPS